VRCAGRLRLLGLEQQRLGGLGVVLADQGVQSPTEQAQSARIQALRLGQHQCLGLRALIAAQHVGDIVEAARDHVGLRERQPTHSQRERHLRPRVERLGEPGIGARHRSVDRHRRGEPGSDVMGAVARHQVVCHAEHSQAQLGDLRLDLDQVAQQVRLGLGRQIERLDITHAGQRRAHGGDCLIQQIRQTGTSPRTQHCFTCDERRPGWGNYMTDPSGSQLRRATRHLAGGLASIVRAFE
jgi:hypothetical protein